MRFMIIVKSTPEFESAAAPVADEALLGAMATFHEELARAGALLDASGLQPSRHGWRIHYDGSRRHVIDGPFAGFNGVVEDVDEEKAASDDGDDRVPVLVG